MKIKIFLLFLMATAPSFHQSLAMDTAKVTISEHAARTWITLHQEFTSLIKLFMNKGGAIDFQMAKKRAEELLHDTQIALNNEKNASINDMLDMLRTDSIAILSHIAEQTNDLPLAIKHLETLPTKICVPLKLQLLFQHKNDDKEYEIQYQNTEKEIIKLIHATPLIETQFGAIAPSRYGIVLIASGNIKEGIKTLETIPIEFASLFDLLQLCIGYNFGFDDIAPDKEKAQDYCNKIQNKLNEKKIVLKKSTRGFGAERLAYGVGLQKSAYFVEGYMKIFGICVKKDIEAGFKLIEKSESALDDIYISIDDLFPSLKRIKEEWEASEKVKAQERDQAFAQLADSSYKSKSKPSTKKQSSNKTNRAQQQEPQAASSNSQPSTHPPQPTIPTPLALTPETWNAYFRPMCIENAHNERVEDDGSTVTLIDIPNKTFIINDPLRHENLIVLASKIPNFSFKEIGKLDFDKRIAQRQAEDLDPKTRHNHSFARMLDYVIQYAGELVPYLQLGKDAKETLIAPVIRQNTDTGEKVPCTAEYTFGKNFAATRTNTFPVIYHRLLRPQKSKDLPPMPIKKPLSINQASSSNKK